MKVLLRLEGWEKVETVEDHIARRGNINIAIQPPMSLLTPERNITRVEEDGIKVVRFFYTGNVKYGLPIFATTE